MNIKIKLKQIISFSLVAFMLQACAEQGGSLNKEQFGTVLGGIGGAILGSQVGKGDGQLVGTAVGALAGAAIGNSIGGSLDKADLAYAQRATQTTLERAPAGQTMEWRNPDSGHYGTITPTKTFQRSSGEYCREYTQTVTVAGQKQQAYGKACRQPDGTWKIID